MKAIVVHNFYEDLGQINVSNVPQPRAKSDELLIKVVAAGVNFVDILYVGYLSLNPAYANQYHQAQGKHQNNKKHMRPPFTLGLEFAGIIISAPSTSSWKPGDTIFGDASGSFAEYLTLPANSPSLHRMPSSWTFTQAAGLGATLPVSYAALVLRGALKPGETVLVHSAAGGLGSMAIQVAVAFGCKVIGTAGSADKCSYARKLGASECFDYSGTDWWRRVLEATDGRGVDVVFDQVGLVDLSLKCIAHRGRVLVVGFAGLDGKMEQIAMNRVLLKQVTLTGYVSFNPQLNRLLEVTNLLTQIAIWRV